MLTETHDRDRTPAAIEALLFAAGDSLAMEDIAQALDLTPLALQQALTVLELRYADDVSGLQLRFLEDRVQLATKGQYGELLSSVLTPVRTRSLSQSALETLAIIAYQQPITKAEIEAVRGVRSEYAVAVLQSLSLIEEVGRKDALGRPILFGTTEEFLRRFGLESLEQLPDLASFVPVDEGEGDAPLDEEG